MASAQGSIGVGSGDRRLRMRWENHSQSEALRSVGAIFPGDRHTEKEELCRY